MLLTVLSRALVLASLLSLPLSAAQAQAPTNGAQASTELDEKLKKLSPEQRTALTQSIQLLEKNLLLPTFQTPDRLVSFSKQNMTFECIKRPVENTDICRLLHPQGNIRVLSSTNTDMVFSDADSSNKAMDQLVSISVDSNKFRFASLTAVAMAPSDAPKSVAVVAREMVLRNLAGTEITYGFVAINPNNGHVLQIYVQPRSKKNTKTAAVFRQVVDSLSFTNAPVRLAPPSGGKSMPATKPTTK